MEAVEDQVDQGRHLTYDQLTRQTAENRSNHFARYLWMEPRSISHDGAHLPRSFYEVLGIILLSALSFAGEESVDVDRQPNR